MKRKQWRKAGKQSAYRDNGVMEALKWSYGPTHPVSCVICGNDSLDYLSIHQVDDSNEFKVLCNSCRDKITRNSCISVENSINQIMARGSL